MNSRPDQPEEAPSPPPWLAQALDDVSVPAPRAELRDALRSRFVGGVAPEQAHAEAPSRAAASPRDAARGMQRSRRSPNAAVKPRRRWRASWWVLSGLVAASIAVFWLRPAAAPRVELVESALATLTFDGVEIDERELERKWLGGARVRTAGAAARVRLDGVALIELAPDSEVVFTPWNAVGEGEARLELVRGGVRVATAADFAPRKLAVLAPDARIAIVGTEFGVDVLPGVGTCVCCTHGAIEVHPRGREHVERVLAGGMSFCFSSGDAPMLGPVKDDHAADVVALRRFAWPESKR